MIKGNKVTLRPVKRADIENLLIWFNDPEVTQYLRLYLPMTEMMEEKWIEKLAMDTSRLNFMIDANYGKESIPIGSIDFYNIDAKNREAVFGIAIGNKNYWSRGYGSEAAALLLKYGFDQMNLYRIASDVYSFNERSQRLHLKIGFKEEGRRRSAKYINGKYWDVVEYGILESEWRQIQKRQ